MLQKLAFSEEELYPDIFNSFLISMSFVFAYGV
jgi:hypothetical protein